MKGRNKRSVPGLNESYNGEPIEVPAEMVHAMCKQFGWEQMIVIYRKATPGTDPDACMEGMSYSGNNAKNAHVAREIAKFLQKNVMGWVEENAGSLFDIANAEEKSPDGRVDGKKLLVLPTSKKKQ